MAKSLREIEEAFSEQRQLQNSKEKEAKKEKTKKQKISLLSDVIFYTAMAGAAVMALIISRSGVLSGTTYDVFYDYRNIILVGFLFLIIVSFVLKFLENRRE